MCAQQLEPGITLIVGIGVTGVSCARYLQQQGATLRVVDSRAQPPLLAELRQQLPEDDVRTGEFKDEYLEGVERILLSPGVPLAHPFIRLAAQRGIEIIGDIELFARNVNKPVIAITGSNGKSTVTTLLGEMLDAAGMQTAVGGNLGTPALDLLLDSEPDVFVLELSSFQLETTESLKTTAAVVLNISEDHMDRYDNLSAYAASKLRIYSQSGCCVVNKDDSLVASTPLPAVARRICFTGSEPGPDEFGLVIEADRTWLCYGRTRLLAADELKLIGRHNLLNALAALALAEGCGVELEKTLPALKNFAGLPHRCQWVAEHNRIRWINDSKATNVGAAEAAIASMPGNIVLIAGGDGKGADFSSLRAAIADRVRAVILLGKDAARIEQALQGVTACHRVTDMQAAVRQAGELAQPGDTVLLAPACASLDMYKNYMARGDDFARCVLAQVDE